MPFLTLMDDRAKPKGSRDPLGFELVWTYFGRKVIGNLTTITSSMDNFAVAILGFYWANLIAQGVEDTKRHETIKSTFLRYEQLTGYLRYYSDAGDIMGITRVRQRASDDAVRLTLGLATDQLILSDQASYGLWGLYSTAARDTGLIHGNDRELTELGKLLVGLILEGLGDKQQEIFDLISSTQPLNRELLKALSPVFMAAIHGAGLQSQLLDALMGGPPNHALQKELWHISRRLFAIKNIKHPERFQDLIETSLQSGASEQLKHELNKIVEVERLLVASNDLFHYCRRKDGTNLDILIAGLAEKRDYSYLPQQLPDEDFPRRDELVSILARFRSNDLHGAITKILALNKQVMQHRGGAPWVELENGQTLRVRVKSETSELRAQEALQTEWDYDYFIGSFLAIARQHLVH